MYSLTLVRYSAYDVFDAKRAAPLPSRARREAIITAVLPFLADRGTAVTSRELSEAAGVAEGTIFKAFTDKDDLFRAALDRVVDPEPTERAIRSIDPALPYEQRSCWRPPNTCSGAWSTSGASCRSSVRRASPRNAAPCPPAPPPSSCSPPNPTGCASVPRTPPAGSGR